MIRKPMSCEALREAVDTWPELERLRRLRAAIVWWPYRTCEQYCASRADAPCDCGWGRANEERAVARKLLGIDNEV